MGANNLNSMEIDAVGEILNISLGASATAVSTMLDARVDITTPTVRVVGKEEFEFSSFEPAVGVEITYVSGLTGNNLMILKRQDVKVIVEMLMGMEIPDEEFELNEMNISAICEVMNQMMGASSTALSELLGRMVNISTPISFEVEDETSFKEKYFGEYQRMVVVSFVLRISGKLESEFLSMMPIPLAKELVSGFFPGISDTEDEEESNAQPETVQETPVSAEEPERDSNAVMSQDEIAKLLAQMDEAGSSENIDNSEANTSVPNAVQPSVEVQPQPQVIPEQQPQPTMQPQQQVPSMEMQPQQMVQPSMQYSNPTLEATMLEMQKQQQMMMQQMMQLMQNQQTQQSKPQAPPKQVRVHTPIQPNLQENNPTGEDEEVNLELIKGVPLEVSVEIGRTKKLVKDILEFNKGTLVVLDKLAGEQVDLFVNGYCIAKGDVVVVEDNFGIRITEILQDEITIE